MKVLQFVADGAPGGGTNHVIQLLTGLGANYENVLLTQEHTYLYNLTRSKGIKVIGGDFFRSRTDRDAVAKIREVIAAEKPDLIHCHGGRAGFFRSFLSDAIPTAYTVHGFHHAQKSLIPKTMGWIAEYWTMRRMDHVFFVSDYDRQLAVRQKLLPINKSFRVVHNGIAPLEPKVASDRLGVGFIGRFVYQKNPELFLDVVERLPHLDFVMAGGGELDEKIRADVESRGLGDRVTLVGSLDHKSALEFISNLEHGKTGMLSESENADELADHVSKILDDYQLRESIVENAFDCAHAKFSQDAMLDQIRASYYRTCEAGYDRATANVEGHAPQQASF